MESHVYVCGVLLTIDWTAVAAVTAVIALVIDIVRRIINRYLEGRALEYLIQPELGDISNFLNQAKNALMSTPDEVDTWMPWANRIRWPVIESVTSRLHVLSSSSMKSVTALVTKLTGVRRMVNFVMEEEDKTSRDEYIQELIKEMSEAREMVVRTRLTDESKEQYREYLSR